MSEAKTIYRIEINVGAGNGVGGSAWRPVGLLYQSKDVAKSWVTFVKKAWHAKSARVVAVRTVRTVRTAR